MTKNVNILAILAQFVVLAQCVVLALCAILVSHPANAQDDFDYDLDTPALLLIDSYIEKSREISSRYDADDVLQTDTAEQIVLFEEMVSPRALTVELSSLNDLELDELGSAYSGFVSNVQTPAALADLEWIRLEQDKRGLLSEVDQKNFLNLLLQLAGPQRRQSYAFQNRETNPLEPTDRLVMTPLPSGEWHIEAMDFADYTGVVMIKHPHCGFCQLAVQTIEADPALMAALEDNSLWLVSAAELDEPSVIVRWNQEHPFPLRYASDANEWPELDFSSIPRFYVFRDGVLVQKLTGWPEDNSQLPKLIAALADIGVTLPG